jgi:hypothetical protein
MRESALTFIRYFFILPSIVTYYSVASLVGMSDSPSFAPSSQVLASSSADGEVGESHNLTLDSHANSSTQRTTSRPLTLYERGKAQEVRVKTIESLVYYPAMTKPCV